THEKMRISGRGHEYQGSMPEILHSLFLMRRDAQKEIKEGKPIRELEKGINQINTIFNNIDSGNYEVKKYDGC
ncbi:MAG: hypothetical protein ABIF18_03050, partial [archaeon]